MSAYDDRLGTLRDLARQALDAVVDVGGRENQPYGAAVNRLERVLGYAVAVLDATEGDLLGAPVSDSLTAQFNQFLQFPDDPQTNAQTIATNADPWADSLLAQLSTLPLARDQDFAQLASEAAGDYQASVRDKLDSLNANFDTAQERIDQIMTEATTRLDGVAADVNGQRATFAEQLAELRTAFEARLAEFDQTITAERAAIEQTKTSQAETFRTAQNERDAAFKSALEEAGQKLELLVASSNRTVQVAVAEIQRMEQESAALVGAIGLAGTAERYGQEVTEQRKAANTWRKITVVFSLVAAIAVVVVAITLGHNPKWEDFLGKLAASALIGGLAAYAARQSARHREREERARNFQLELTAFSPFIEPLSKEQQEEERVVMTRKTFGKAATEVSAEEEPGPHPLSFVLRRKEDEAQAG